MGIFIQLIASGAVLGMIYGIVAFGYQLTFATSKTLNFGQGEALMLGALVGLTLTGIAGYWAMIPLVMLFGMGLGVVVERLGVRPAMRIKSEYGWIMSTIALGIIFRNLAENIWGRDPLRFPSPLPDAPLVFGTVRILPTEILIILGAAGLMVAIELFNRYSIYGKAVIATANDRAAAELMGIDSGRVIVLSYAISALTAAFAGVLIAPVTQAGAMMGANLALKAFAVAIIGGLDSGIGAIVGGILLGVAETTTGYYLSTGYKDVPGLVLLLLVLAVKPSGLFGHRQIKKL